MHTLTFLIEQADSSKISKNPRDQLHDLWLVLYIFEAEDGRMTVETSSLIWIKYQLINVKLCRRYYQHF